MKCQNEKYKKVFIPRRFFIFFPHKKPFLCDLRSDSKTFPQRKTFQRYWRCDFTFISTIQVVDVKLITIDAPSFAYCLS